MPAQHSPQKLCTRSTIVPHPAQRGGSAKSSANPNPERTASDNVTGSLSRRMRQRTSALVPPELFDMDLRAVRRDRAFRLGPELFLWERAFGDCMDRLSFVTRSFDRALLIGCPDSSWRGALSQFVRELEVLEPGPLFAAASAGTCVREDRWAAPFGQFDLCVAIGTLDTVNDLPRALGSIRSALRSDGLLLGALAGGDSFPQLRAAMFAADQVAGVASPHVHPRIDPPTLAGLLGAADFVMPVVDVDRVKLSYPSLGRLVADLRAMGGTNILTQRSRRPLARAALRAAEAAFSAAGERGATLEQVDILNFAAWTPHGEPALMER